MTQLPLLVKELIGWYIWKDKIKECNKEYHKTVENYDDYKFYDWKIYNDTMEKSRNSLQFRDFSRPYNLDDYYICNFTCIRPYNTVANLPQKYFYSSGMNNPKGFSNKNKSHKKVNSWLFQL
jgi:hypothetical protein